MKKLLKLFLKNQLKPSTKSRKSSGFTLIELLVAIIISGLVLLPLLGFMINLMETDRREQAKTASEQEIQAALNYISRDLDQAIFIYDGFGVESIRADLPNVNGGTPVLVFWKRNFLEDFLPLKDGNANDCKPNGPGTNCDDGFVYSMVAYYLIQDTTDLAWSGTARIGRVELKDQLIDLNNQSDPPRIIRQRDPGFVVFNLSPINPLLATATLEQKMNAWPNPPASVTPGPGSINENQLSILIDYIDQTPFDPNLSPNDPKYVPIPSCPTDPRSGPLPDGTDGAGAPYPNRLVPPTPTLSSFYACVDTEKTTAQVFIRGNASARLRPRNSPSVYVKSASTYFPSSNILVQGRGFIQDGSKSQ